MNISIILPTFNRSSILKKTIRNIQNQTFQNYELIIINDASNDNTINMVTQLQKTDHRIKLINNNQNVGCAKSRMLGLEKSSAPIIAFIDDDDKWHENKLMKQYNAITHNNIDAVISDYCIIKENKKKHVCMKAFSINLKFEILKRPGPFFQSIMIKKELIKKMNNPFDSQAIPSEDWNFFIELSKLNPSIKYIKEPLFTWHLHSNNQSLNFTQEAKALYYIITKHYNYIKKEHGFKMIAKHYRAIARLYEKNDDVNNITRFYIKAFKMNPMSIKNIFYFFAVMIGYKYSRGLINCIRQLRGMPNA